MCRQAGMQADMRADHMRLRDVFRFSVKNSLRGASRESGGDDQAPMNSNMHIPAVCSNLADQIQPIFAQFRYRLHLLGMAPLEGNVYLGYVSGTSVARNFRGMGSCSRSRAHGYISNINYQMFCLAQAHSFDSHASAV